MENIKGNTWFGLKWTVIGTIVQMSVQLIQLFVLSKYLGPTLYGEAMLGVIIVRMLNPFAIAGVGNVLIQEKNLSQEQLSTLFYCNLIFSVVVYLLLFCTAPLFSIIFTFPNFVIFARIGALILLFYGVSNISNSLLIKELEFKNLNKIQIASSLLELFISLTITYLGMGEWALLLGFLSRVVLSSILQVFIGKKYFFPAFFGKISEIKPILMKCAYNMSAQTINMLSTNMDNLLVGKYFGITNLGYYTLAWDLALKPVYAIVPMFMKVKMPIWAKLKQNKEDLLEDFKQSIVMLSLPLILLYFVGYFVVPYFIPFWYGEKWLPSVALLQILIFIGMTRCVGSLTNTLALTLGFFKVEFYINCFQLFCYLILLPMSIYFFQDMAVFCWVMVMGYVVMDTIWYVFLWRKF